MNAVRAIEKELIAIGYKSEAIFRDYDFANVLSSAGESRSVALAAFTQVPESYRSAAFGVITETENNEITIADRRALGAPILFSIGESDIGVWRVGAQGSPRLIERVTLDALPELFRRNADQWHPQAIHRAKSLGQNQAAYQLDFIDLGLLAAIEHEVEEKLDKLLQRVIEQLLSGLSREKEESAFRTTFRLLAAKILLDRGHSVASTWRTASVDKVLSGIEAYYHLGHLASRSPAAVSTKAASAAWQVLRDAISFRNISSDSLAFVYENTLVTADTRKRFGTHSTPRQVAEYVVSRLNLSQFNLENLIIYEPFAGAGSFLVAALRYMRDLLPDSLSAEERHAFLVPRIRGAEIDAFACEVATLSLILADYPNANGWRIKCEDLFQPGALARDLASAKVVLCNPPWEDFDTEERDNYPDMVEKSFSKPMAVLKAVLEERPAGIGFVFPQGFLRQQQYSELRQQVSNLYQRIELTSLPDRVFQRAGFEAAILTASELRTEQSTSSTKLLSAVVSDSDRVAFLARGEISAERRRTKIVQSGDLWIGELEELWEHLKRYPTLGDVADIYRGLKWWKQGDGVSSTPHKGYSKGVFKPADSLSQYEIGKTVYLNTDPAAAMRPAPLTRPWNRPKVLTNVARMSRGPWRMAATYDTTGLVASQAFFGIWPKDSNLPGEALEALLNSPLTNAFLFEHATNQHFTNELLKQLPIPKVMDWDNIVKAVNRYRDALSIQRQNPLGSSQIDDHLNRLLVEVDAEVLKNYSLPPRLERRLLEFFRGHENARRINHAFKGWMPKDFTAFVPLHEYLGPLIKENLGSWVLETFTPAPNEEIEQIEQYIGG
ncbi:MAG: N-6 DNA methylase [Ferrovibrio sp.]|uniref:N-6 DNA methylase n=1 Tax=Ferrovibrio sp. TaxID=1917215 RepID=UPI00391BC83B